MSTDLINIENENMSCLAAIKRYQATKKPIKTILCGVVSLLLLKITPTFAHGPIFSPGPETLYKDGIEFQLDYYRSKSARASENEQAIGLGYGITQDWEISVELPYLTANEDGSKNSGTGNVQLETRYRLWRMDSFGKQDSITGFVTAVLDTAKQTINPMLSYGANDFIVGLAYGQESLIWQRWASLSYRFNGENDDGLNRGDQLFADASIGWRSEMPQYYKSDTLWMIELNVEHSQTSQQNNISLKDSGGTEVFISPGVIWAYRNIALKGGIQLPIYNNLKGDQNNADHRIKFSIDINY